MYAIKQSTALTVPFFIHDAAGDAVTGLVDGGFTLKRISKNGGAFGAMAVTITEMENGWYSIPLSAGHSDTLGLLTLVFQGASGKQVNLQWRVSARIKDDLAYPTTSGRSIDVEATGEVGINLDNTVGALGTSDFDAAFFTAALFAAGALDANALATDAVDEIVDATWDEILTGATHNVVDSAGRRLRDLQEFGVYEGGAVWIDTINGAPGTTDFESGTVFNPVNTLADANTLATSLGLTRFRVAPGSSIAFIAAQQGQTFHGMGWTLALGGQDIANSTIIGATVSGIAAGVGAQTFVDCFMGAVTLPDNTEVITCAIQGTQTLPAGDIFYARCHSAIAGLVAPLFDFGAAVANTNLSIRNYSGGVDLRNMGQLGVDAASIEGRGQVIVNANCTGGTIVIRGPFTLTDAGAATITQDARSPDNWGLTGIEADGHVHGDLKEWLGAAPNALIAGAVDSDVSVIQANVITAAVIATNAIDADALATDAVDEIVDQTWDELIAGHLGVGSTGEALNGATAPTAAVVADAVWDELQAGHVGAGSFGLFLDSIVSNIQADTDNIQTRLPAALVGGAMDSDVSNMQANVVDASALALDAGQEIADRVLSRSLATGADGGRTVQDALRALRNRREVAGGVLTVFTEGDAVAAWTAAVTTAAGDPISEIDPA